MQFITLRDALQTRLSEKIETGNPVIEFPVLHTSDTLNRYHVGSDGRTSYQRWKGKQFKRVVPEFGEKVLYLKLGSLKEPKRDKGESRWAEGHFLGVRNETGELIIGTNEGIIKAKDFKRLADPQQRWNAASLKQIRGSPWKPNPDVEDGEIHVKVKLPRDNEPITTQFRGVENEPNVRRLRIQPEIIKKLGFIINCNGCRAIRDKEPVSRNHNEECRKRYENI